MTAGELWRRLVFMLHRERFREELEEEMQLHRSLSADPQRFGNVGVALESSRDVWGVRWLDSLEQDLRHAVRALAKTPGFTTAAILTLTLAIGATSAVFSVVNGVLLRPLPFHEQQRLYMLAEQNRNGDLRPPSYPTFLDWQAQATAFADIAYVRGGGQRLHASEGVQSIITSYVSSGFFRVLGERPLLGRLFTADEEQGGARVAVLSYDLWRGRFGGDPRILSTTLSMSDGVYTVIGILPRDVAYPPWTQAQLYVPLTTTLSTDRALTQRGFHADCRIIGRLAPGVTEAQATEGLNTIARREAAVYPAYNADWTTVRWIPIRDEILGDVRLQLLVLLVAVCLLLLIACVNVANLTLARCGARGKEFAIRAALGAGKWRVLRQLLTESALVTATGALLGTVAAYVGVGALRRYGMSLGIPRLETVELDGRVLAFALGATCVTLLITGFLPALRTRPNLSDWLKGAVGARPQGRRLRTALVICEISMASILVIGTGLLVRSLWLLRAVNPGFDPAGLVTFFISPPSDRAQDAAKSALYAEIEASARALPGVSDAALTNFTPLSGGGLPSPVEVAGRAPDSQHDPQVLLLTVSPGYFRTMRIPLRAGREFTTADLSPGVAIVVNEAFVNAFLPNQDPIGHEVTLHNAVQGRAAFGAPMPGIVTGVVGDVHHFGLDTPAEPQVYVPYTRLVWGHMSLVVRATNDPSSIFAPLQRLVRRSDPETPMSLGDGRPAVGLVSRTAGLESRQLDTWLLTAFALTALLLAALGVYGLLTYSVAQRRNEIGIRVALGAARGDVMRLVVGDSVRLAIVGVVLGIGGALALTHLLAGLLYGVGASDPWTFAGVSVFLVLVALGASYVPARRAARVEPMAVLRQL